MEGFKMTREEKINKLNELGIYAFWFRNVKKDVNKLLNKPISWRSFIDDSFWWTETREGYEYWEKISRK